MDSVELSMVMGIEDRFVMKPDYGVSSCIGFSYHFPTFIPFSCCLSIFCHRRQKHMLPILDNIFSLMAIRVLPLLLPLPPIPHCFYPTLPSPEKYRLIT